MFLRVQHMRSVTGHSSKRTLQLGWTPNFCSSLTPLISTVRCRIASNRSLPSVPRGRMSRCGATWQGRGVYWAPEANTNIRHRQHGALSLTFRPIPGTDWPDSTHQEPIGDHHRRSAWMDALSSPIPRSHGNVAYGSRPWPSEVRGLRIMRSAWLGFRATEGRWRTL